MKVLLYIVLCSVGCSSTVIYHLNDTEYERMPNLLHLDPYEKCLEEPGALYCTVGFTLVSDEPSPLLNMIEEYSEHTPRHFNHSVLFHGICVKHRCEEFITNTTVDLKYQLEVCLNKTFFENYHLKTKAFDGVSCGNEEKAVDAKDIIVAILLLCLLMLNLVGTSYDVLFTKGKSDDGTKFLVYFSIRRNLRKLITTKDTDPRLSQLKGFNGIRTISIIMVIMAHSLAVTSLFVNNPHYVEKVYLNPIGQLILNGNLTMQTFFVMSGFFLVFHYCIYTEKNKCDWKLLLKGLLMRWLRLTPTYAVVLAFISTWYRHLGSGPLWNRMVTTEVVACRQYWWWHLIYLNNYLNESGCMPETWYLAADMQLYCIGITIFVFCRSKARRVIVLLSLFVIGAIIPALHTYYQDLNAVMIVSPEAARNFLITDDTFNYVYKRSHTNIPGYIIGLVTGYIVYHFNDFGIDLNKYKKYRGLYWFSLPLLIGTIYAGSIFYIDRPRLPLSFRAVYAGLVKPVFGAIVAVLIMGVVLKFENLYRSVLEWDGWIVPSKLCYSAYLLHLTIFRCFMGSETTIENTSIMSMANSFCGHLVITFVAAYSLWLLVEAPLGQLVKALFMKTKKSIADEETMEDKLDKVDIRL